MLDDQKFENILKLYERMDVAFANEMFIIIQASTPLRQGLFVYVLQRSQI